MFIAKKMPGAFTYLVIDELHERKSEESAQANACDKLISATRYRLGPTGTLIGGYANHLFRLLMRMSAGPLGEEGFERARDLAFTERYSRIERITEHVSGARRSDRPKQRTASQGKSPAVEPPDDDAIGLPTAGYLEELVPLGPVLGSRPNV
jgi:hypothetical protein